MEMKAVKSSNINAYGYDAPTRELHVEFKGGNLYRYFEVPAHVADGFAKAESVGGYFHKNIRGKFDFAAPSAQEPAPKEAA